MLKTVALLSVVVGFAYFLFYPFIKNKVNRKRLFRWCVAIYILIMLASTINTYFLS